MARWHALRATLEERFVPRFRHYALTLVAVGIPILLHYHSTRVQKVRDKLLPSSPVLTKAEVLLLSPLIVYNINEAYVVKAETSKLWSMKLPFRY